MASRFVIVDTRLKRQYQQTEKRKLRSQRYRIRNSGGHNTYLIDYSFLMLDLHFQERLQGLICHDIGANQGKRSQRCRPSA